MRRRVRASVLPLWIFASVGAPRSQRKGDIEVFGEQQSWSFGHLQVDVGFTNEPSFGCHVGPAAEDERGTRAFSAEIDSDLHRVARRSGSPSAMASPALASWTQSI